MTFIWAGNFHAAKYALAVVDSLVLIALRMLVGALLLLVLVEQISTVQMTGTAVVIGGVILTTRF